MCNQKVALLNNSNKKTTLVAHTFHWTVSHKIEKIEFNRLQEFEQFNELHGTIFLSQKWLELQPEVDRYGIFNGSNQLDGIFCLLRTKRKGLGGIQAPFLTPSIGPYLNQQDSTALKRQAITKSMLKVLVEFLKSQSEKIKVIPLDQNIHDTQHFSWQKFNVTPRYTYLLDLTKAEEQLISEMGTRKRNIKKAYQDELRVERQVDSTISIPLILGTFKKQGVKMDRSLLHSILSKATNKWSISAVVYKNELPVSVAFCVFDSRTCYYILGGYAAENKHHGAGPLAMWDCILQAKEKNIPTFDFEGSMIPEVEKYFREFGGSLTPYYVASECPSWLKPILHIKSPDYF